MFIPSFFFTDFFLITLSTYQPFKIPPNNMQVESSYTKYAGRVPPIDLSQINTNCSTETDLHSMWSTKTDLINSPSHLKRSSQHHPYYHHQPHQRRYLSSQKPAIAESFVTTSMTHLHDFASIDNRLPLDPRDWTRADVWKWLISMAVSEGLEVTPELPQKFPMNGKALCLMSLDMYLSRVPVGGKMLYRDFRVRLAKAMASIS